MSDTLKSCPFCGSAAHTFDTGDNSPVWGVYCHVCDATIGYGYRSEADAIAAWNRRAPIPPKVAATIRGALGNLRSLFNSTLHWWFGKPLRTNQAKNIARLQNEIDRIDAALVWLEEVSS